MCGWEHHLSYRHWPGAYRLMWVSKSQKILVLLNFLNSFKVERSIFFIFFFEGEGGYQLWLDLLLLSVKLI